MKAVFLVTVGPGFDWWLESTSSDPLNSRSTSPISMAKYAAPLFSMQGYLGGCVILLVHVVDAEGGIVRTAIQQITTFAKMAEKWPSQQLQ
jgi:hypothetical protein